MNNSHSIKRSVRPFFKCVFALFILMPGCKDIKTTQSSTPVSAAEAKKVLQGTIPIPNSASNVRYFLSGSTQDWDLYLSYNAPLADIEKTISDELTRLKNKELLISGTPLHFNKEPLTKSTLPPRIQSRSPNWWKPLTIQTGYFIGSSNPDSGARFWIDQNEGRVYFYDHF